MYLGPSSLISGILTFCPTVVEFGLEPDLYPLVERPLATQVADVEETLKQGTIRSI
jgi:hypothetical protein